ncbi:MAG: translation initiation factor IF-2 [Minisyncoccia bacterium]
MQLLAVPLNRWYYIEMPQTMSNTKRLARPPVVAVVGHIDHGKSTLLDYIRKTSVAEGEAGGITQHVAAYEAEHVGKTITFIDTPGHEAFIAMRSRSLAAADIAILVVSAEDGVKPQTIEAYRLIEETKTPLVVALTKIDKPGADIERARKSLIEHEMYLEGMGGTVPSVGVSGKSGEGVSELLDLLLLQAELSQLSYDPKAPARGIVIEARASARRGTSATLIVKEGVLRGTGFVVAGSAFSPMRIMENFAARLEKEISAGRPAVVVGFSALPKVGSEFFAVKTKKETEAAIRDARADTTSAPRSAASEGEAPAVPPLVIALVVKADVAGSGEAVAHELAGISQPLGIETRLLASAVGAITENDVRLAGSGEHPGIVIGFNVKADAGAMALAERLGVAVATFAIIYELSDWLAEELERRRPRQRLEEKAGVARILKIFSADKKSAVLGGRVESGRLFPGAEVRIMRRDLTLGEGIIESLQSQRKSVRSVEAGQEFGAMVRTDATAAPGDYLEAVEVVYK